jgi:predicted dehydrogenase
VRLCSDAGIVLSVNQNMRYDQSVRACKDLLDRGDLGVPVLGTIEMRAIPHWMPWQQRQGWVTLRIMSIHHLDTFRFWFGDPDRVFASVRPDPRTARRFDHEDGICLYILEYGSGLRATAWDDVWTGPAREGAEADIGIRWRVEGTDGLARGTIGWPAYPQRVPSTMDFTTCRRPGYWFQPRWTEVWFPDAFVGTMAQLLCALEDGAQPQISGEDNLRTMALVEACYVSAREHRAVSPDEIHAT